MSSFKTAWEAASWLRLTWPGDNACQDIAEMLDRQHSRIDELDANRLDVVRVVDALIASIADVHPKGLASSAWYTAHAVLVALRKKLVKP